MKNEKQRPGRFFDGGHRIVNYVLFAVFEFSLHTGGGR